MAFMKDILTHNIPIWEECAATPFVQEVQTGKLPLEKFKRYMIQDSIYLKNYARIYGKAIFHAATLREIQLYYSMLNFVNDTESEVRLDYLKQFCITDDDIELIAPLPENQNYIDFMFEITSRSFTNFLRSSLNSIIPVGSSPLTGSSKIKNSGSPNNATPKASLCFIPKEKFATLFLPALDKPINSRVSVIHFLFGIPRCILCTSKF